MISLRENEKIYLSKRRHKFVLWSRIIPIFLLFLIIMIIGLILLFSELNWPDWLIDFWPEVNEISPKLFMLFILSLLFLIFWIVLFVSIANYYLDCWIVTNERTIHT